MFAEPRGLRWIWTRPSNPLCLVPNSGASGAPHLHFTMSDRDGFSIPGRYQFEVLSTSGWQVLDGLNVEEGWNFRPAAE